MIQLIKTIKSRIIMYFYAPRELRKALLILSSNNLYQADNINKLKLIYAKFSDNFIKSLQILDKTQNLNQTNFDNLCKFPYIFEALKTLEQARLLNSYNLNYIYANYWRPKEAALQIKVNYLLRHAEKAITPLSSTYIFLRSLTDVYISSYLNSTRKKTMQASDNCAICWTQEQDESITVSCGHKYHPSCFTKGINAYLLEENITRIGICWEENCDYNLTSNELGKLVNDADTIVGIQKISLRNIDGLLFCPKCPYGMTMKQDVFVGFAYTCDACGSESCFTCGKKPHPKMNCNEATEVDDKFLKQLIRTGESKNYGKCPYCMVTIEHHSGCDSMVCGRDAHGEFIMTSSGKGCGNRFEWESRITIEEWVDPKTAMARITPALNV